MGIEKEDILGKKISDDFTNLDIMIADHDHNTSSVFPNTGESIVH